jgi:hypothetical protein
MGQSTVDVDGHDQFSAVGICDLARDGSGNSGRRGRSGSSGRRKHFRLVGSGVRGGGAS